jgi:hypothetical protein
MGYYKITNITNTFSKRDVFFNKTVEIEYIDRMTKKTYSLKPADSMYLSVVALPMSVQKLKIKGQVIVSEIDKDFFKTGVENKQQEEKKVVEQQHVDKSIDTDTKNKKKSNTKQKKNDGDGFDDKE